MSCSSRLVLLSGILLIAGCSPSGMSSTGGSGTGGAGGAASGNAGEPQADLSGLSGTIRIDGSSSLYPVTMAAAHAFGTATRGKVKLPVGEGGTGSGFKKFLRGELDICDASRPI